MKILKIVACLFLFTIGISACTEKDEIQPQQEQILSNEEVRLGFQQMFKVE